MHARRRASSREDLVRVRRPSDPSCRAGPDDHPDDGCGSTRPRSMPLRRVADPGCRTPRDPGRLVDAGDRTVLRAGGSPRRGGSTPGGRSRPCACRRLVHRHRWIDGATQRGGRRRVAFYPHASQRAGSRWRSNVTEAATSIQPATDSWRSSTVLLVRSGVLRRSAHRSATSGYRSARACTRAKWNLMVVPSGASRFTSEQGSPRSPDPLRSSSHRPSRTSSQGRASPSKTPASTR